MDSLAVLTRLARRALDEERRALVGLDQVIGATSEQLRELHAAAERERRAAGALTDGNARLIAYLRRVDARVQALRAELRRLDAQREVRRARLAERHVELKRLELLAERRAQRARAERARREQQAIEELVVVREHRRRLLTP